MQKIQRPAFQVPLFQRLAPLFACALVVAACGIDVEGLKAKADREVAMQGSPSNDRVTVLVSLVAGNHALRAYETAGYLRPNQADALSERMRRLAELAGVEVEVTADAATLRSALGQSDRFAEDGSLKDSGGIALHSAANGTMIAADNVWSALENEGPFSKKWIDRLFD